jgi:hypothetical protein
MNNDPVPHQPQSEPGIANAEEGLVVLDGPDGLAVTMTADAAARTGRSLITAAEIAVLQVAQKAQSDDMRGRADATD